MHKGTDGSATDVSTSRLPAERAFVLQLRPQADAGADPFVGRIEHLASGTAEQFTSAAGLIRFVKLVLGSGPEERIVGEEEA